MTTAREAWREYYRAVRVIRRLRQTDEFTYRRFSTCWWNGSYQFERLGYVNEAMAARLTRARHGIAYRPFTWKNIP